MSTVALIGNGFSIAYNPALTIGALTGVVRSAFAASARGDAASAALDRIAEANSGFEELLGPLDAVAALLPALTELLSEDSPLIESDTRATLWQTAKLLRAVYLRGTAITLEAIAERTATHDGDAFTRVRRFMTETVNAAQGNLTLGTVNYDGLLHAVMLDAGEKICDLGSGLGQQQSIRISSERLTGRPLRAPEEPLAGGIPVLQLHGSLGWVRHQASGQILKMNIPALRNARFWSALQGDLEGVEPVVILANQATKAQLTRVEPFASAYQRFFEATRAANRWLIAGYGFGDSELNNRLRAALKGRSRPRILVITFGAHPSDATVEGVLGQHTMLRCGVVEAAGNSTWSTWWSAP